MRMGPIVGAIHCNCMRLHLRPPYFLYSIVLLDVDVGIFIRRDFFSVEWFEIILPPPPLPILFGHRPGHRSTQDRLSLLLALVFGSHLSIGFTMRGPPPSNFVVFSLCLQHRFALFVLALPRLVPICPFD